VTPRFNGGVPHYSGAMPYRPTVNYGNGNRTLNYPPVGNSVLRHQIHSGANSLNTGYALQRSGGNLNKTANLHQPSALNALAKNKLDPQIYPSPQLERQRPGVSRTRLNHATTVTITTAQLVETLRRHHLSDWGWWGWYDGW
jgi:hypothetical protein